MTEQTLPYELELFLSTDGKHTVRLKVLPGEDILVPLTKAKSLYDKIVEAYGLKPERSGGFPKKPAAPKQSAGMCPVHNEPMFLNKNGKKYHMDRTRIEGDQFCNGRGFPNENDPTVEDFS